MLPGIAAFSTYLLVPAGQHNHAFWPYATLGEAIRATRFDCLREERCSTPADLSSGAPYRGNTAKATGPAYVVDTSWFWPHGALLYQRSPDRDTHSSRAEPISPVHLLRLCALADLADMHQLQAHLQRLAKVAVRAHLDEAHPQVHPHTIEAVRHVSGHIFPEDEGSELFGGTAQPHLLHEPYMSAEGAVGMLGQTLADIARKVDQEAETRGTLESPEFAAFRELVRSVYVGSLQKRVEDAEGSARLPANPEERTGKAPHTKTPKAKEDGGEDSQDPQRTAENAGNQEYSEKGAEERPEGGAGKRNKHKPGAAVAGHQACSGDIAQALVAMAMGEGFERFASAPPAGGKGSAQAKNGKGDNGQRAPPLTEGNTRAHNSAAKGARVGSEGVKGADGSSKDSSGLQQQLLQRQKENLERAAAGLRYLSEEDVLLGKRLPVQNKKDGKIVAGTGSGSENDDGIFPGLEWLVPHIIGRSIPMELRYSVVTVASLR